MADRSFRGRREVVLIGADEHFRALEDPEGAGRAVLAAGAPLGAPLEALAQRGRLADLAGRFALVVHDPGARTLAVHTDRHGRLPVYRAGEGDRLHLGLRVPALLERKAVAGRLDRAGLADALAFHAPLGERTLLEGVRCLPAGARTVIDLDTLELRSEVDWDATALLRAADLPFEELREELVERFVESTRAALDGSRRATVTLSGGLDTRCILAAALALAAEVEAAHVSVPGARAGRYARRIAEAARVPLRAYSLDASFGRGYHAQLERAVAALEGMKLAPQPEMLWLRDRLADAPVVLHGAFGELAKLPELRDFRWSAELAAGGRAELAPRLWARFAPRREAALAVFSPEFRRELTGAYERLQAFLEALDPELDLAGALQLAYLRQFMKETSFAHRMWNDVVPTRFPFLGPQLVDRLLRVRPADRMEPRLQRHLLARLAPQLAALPDENTGLAAGASALRRRLARGLERGGGLLRGRPLGSAHGDLPAWLAATEPPLEALVEERGADPLYDRRALRAMAADVRSLARRPGPLRVPRLRRARRSAASLETFLQLEAWRRWLRASGARPL